MFDTIDITPFVRVKMFEAKKTKFPVMVHVPSNEVIKSWAAIEGMEEGAWHAMIAYAEAAVQLDAVNWEAEDYDDLFPFPGFVEKYLDPVGTGEKTVAEVSAMLMERIIRSSA